MLQISTLSLHLSVICNVEIGFSQYLLPFSHVLNSGDFCDWASSEINGKVDADAQSAESGRGRDKVEGANLRVLGQGQLE
jgi:hypothetical protein